MIDWHECLVSADATIRQTVEVIDKNALHIAVVVDEQNELLGTVTDGDVRRALLRGIETSSPVSSIMNSNPHFADEGISEDILSIRMTTEGIRQMPLVDPKKRVVSVAFYDQIANQPPARTNSVVLMAGGLGTRLRPLTNDTPKPLLPVGNKPLLETTLESLIKHNFRHILISVNYKSEMIRDYFGDGSKWGAEIEYIDEEKRMGTAGSLRLIQKTPDAPFIVMNGDLLTRVNFHHLLDYHLQSGASATMCVGEYDFQIPFGVVDIDGNRITKINEKPLHSFYVNAGIYVLNPSVLDLIPEDRPYDMTELFDALIQQDEMTCVFPIREYWLDIGRMDDLHRAKSEFDEIFSQ